MLQQRTASPVTTTSSMLPWGIAWLPVVARQALRPVNAATASARVKRTALHCAGAVVLLRYSASLESMCVASFVAVAPDSPCADVRTISKTMNGSVACATCRAQH